MRRQRKKKKGGCLRGFLAFLMCLIIAFPFLYIFTENLGKSEDFLLKSYYPLKYLEIVEKASEDYNLDKALIFAVIKTESGFNPDAESPVGAKGLMQIMPESFKWLQKLKGEELVDNKIMNPEVNIDYGCYLLKYFLDYYKTEQCAVAAYNAGFVVSDWLKNPQYSTDGRTLSSIPYKETADYVNKVEKAKEMYIKLYYSEK